MLRPRLLTILCYTAMMSLAIGINLLPIFLTSIQHSFPGPEGSGLTQEQLGRLGAVAFSGLVVGILITGPLADRFGAKAFALLGNTLLAVGLGVIAWSPTYGMLLAATCCLGLGAGILDMVLSPIVAAINPERRAAAMNWLHSFYCVGAVVTVVAGTLALQAGLGWRVASLLLVPLPFALACVLGAMRFPALTTEGEERIPLRSLLRDIWFIGALGAIFLGGATELGMAQWLPAYAETSLGYPQWVGGAALLLFSVAMAVGRMGIGTLSSVLDSYTHGVELCPFGCPVPRRFVTSACLSRSLCLHSGWAHRQLLMAYHARRHCRPLSQRRCYHVWSLGRIWKRWWNFYALGGGCNRRLFQPSSGPLHLHTRPAYYASHGPHA
jgi:MFS family permease